jgi:hypothetical protein
MFLCVFYLCNKPLSSSKTVLLADLPFEHTRRVYCKSYYMYQHALPAYISVPCFVYICSGWSFVAIIIHSNIDGHIFRREQKFLRPCIFFHILTPTWWCRVCKLLWSREYHRGACSVIPFYWNLFNTYEIFSMIHPGNTLKILLEAQVRKKSAPAPAFRVLAMSLPQLLPGGGNHCC